MFIKLTLLLYLYILIHREILVYYIVTTTLFLLYLHNEINSILLLFWTIFWDIFKIDKNLLIHWVNPKMYGYSACSYFQNSKQVLARACLVVTEIIAVYDIKVTKCVDFLIIWFSIINVCSSKCCFSGGVTFPLILWI